MNDQPEQQPTVAAVHPRSSADTRTGDDAVDAALVPLADLDQRPVDEHVAVLEQAHAALREALSRPVGTA